jgi:Kef-type K+ transport system membrane component KefB
MASAVPIPASVHTTEQLLFFTLLQLTLIVLAARLAGNLAVRWGNARAVGEIVAGLLLGPPLFGLLWPDGFGWVFRSTPAEPLTILSQIGLVLLLFQIGLEFDFSHLRAVHNRRAVVRVAMAGELLPFALGVGFGILSAPYLLSEHHNLLGYALFCGTALAITALPILGRIMLELGLERSALGAIAISPAAIDDVIGWLLLAVVSALAMANFSPGGFALKLGMLAAYIAVCFTLVRPLLRYAIRRTAPTASRLPLDLMGILLGAVFLSAIATYSIGIFAIFGGFMLGVLLSDERVLAAAWRERVGYLVNVFFVPIFFAYTGLRTDIGLLNGWQMWGWCALVIALATLGKLGGCYAAARWTGLDHRSALALGIMMNTRALMELVVINVGYDLGELPRSVFTMLVLMALLSTVVTTPALKRWLGLRSVPDLEQGKTA